MDGLIWLLLIAGAIWFVYWHFSSKRESPPEWAVAPPVPPADDESPITEDEWRYFTRVARAAPAKDRGFAPYVQPYKLDPSADPYYYIRRWNTDALIQWKQGGMYNPDPPWVIRMRPRPIFNPKRVYYPSGVSATLHTREIRVWDGTSESDLDGSKVVRGQGPWNAELRGMVKAIEATLKKPVV